MKNLLRPFLPVDFYVASINSIRIYHNVVMKSSEILEYRNSFAIRTN